MNNKKIILVAACALVDRDNRILLAQRPQGKSMAGLWEFPGGKVEEGETPEAALVRELEEELGVQATIPCLAPLTFASHCYDSFHLLMPLYICRRYEAPAGFGTMPGREGQELKWVAAMDLRKFEMPEADIPLIPHLQELLG